MIQISLGERTDGANTAEAEWNGRIFRAASGKASAMRDVARQLVAAGCPDQAWVSAWGGRPSMRGASLHDMAAVDVRDGDAGLTTGFWAPHPKFGDFALYAALEPARIRLAERAPGRFREGGR